MSWQQEPYQDPGGQEVPFEEIQEEGQQEVEDIESIGIIPQLGMLWGPVHYRDEEN